MTETPERIDPSHAYTFTVFTATYNRASTLSRVRDSLVRQTFSDFEWLIVDDGSTDGTRELVETWLIASPFPIRYIYQANGGKHSAWNVGVTQARGRFFLSIDSDDACTPDALQVFHDAWESIEADRRESFTGVCSLAMNSEGQIVGDPFPRDVFDSDSDALRFKYHVRGDKWGFHRIEVVRRFPFPSTGGLRYVPESIVWGQIANSYQERFINRPLLIIGDDAEVRLTGPGWRNAGAQALGAQDAIEEKARRWFAYDPVFFLKAGANFSRYSWQTSTGVKAQWHKLRGLPARALWLAMLPAGRILYKRDKARVRARQA